MIMNNFTGSVPYNIRACKEVLRRPKQKNLLSLQTDKDKGLIRCYFRGLIRTRIVPGKNAMSRREDILKRAQARVDPVKKHSQNLELLRKQEAQLQVGTTLWQLYWLKHVIQGHQSPKIHAVDVHEGHSIW